MVAVRQFALDLAQITQFTVNVSPALLGRNGDGADYAVSRCLPKGVRIASDPQKGSPSFRDQIIKKEAC